MMEELLAKEEEHADELAMLLEPTRRREATAQRRPVAVAAPTASGTPALDGVSRGRGSS